MTPGQLHEEVRTIDARLGQLMPWEAQLSAGRQERLRNATREAREEIAIIEHGVRGGQGRPSDPMFAPFDSGWPGLIDTRQQIAELQERRTALAEALPDDSERAAQIADSEQRAAEIRNLAATLDERTQAAVAALNDAARLALLVAQQSRTLWEKNISLDKYTRDAAVPRPETPRRDALTYPLAAPLGRLLVGYFMGGQPEAVESDLTHNIERSTYGR
jgi:hypothetical protein